MDYVYICRDGENEELRYSIRSVVKNGVPGKIWVVGSKPKWYSGNFINVPQDGSKYDNAINSLKVITQSKDISNRFVLMNDDFFIIKKIDKIQQYNGGSFFKKVDSYNNLAEFSSYTERLNTTFDTLRSMGYEDPIDYELHVPMVMQKIKLAEILPVVIKKNVLWRTLYGNKYSVKGKTIFDVKVYVNGPLAAKSVNFINQDCPYISSDDHSFNAILHFYLDSMFPYPSEHEKRP